MEELKTLVDWIQSIGLFGFLLLLALPKTREFLGFGSSKVDSDVLADALKKAFIDEDQSPILVKSQIHRICDDVADIRSRQEEMAEDIAFIKGRISGKRP